MPSDDPELRAVEDRLIDLVRCVLTKAETDAEFAEQLKGLLLSDTLRAAVRSKGSTKGRRAVFDPVAFLSQHDAFALRQDLSAKPTSELIQIARQHRVVPSKTVRNIDRDELIAKLVAHAERKLSQGEVFLKSDGKPEQPPGHSSNLEDQTESGTALDGTGSAATQVG